MAQRTDIVSINFQANARGANAAIESLRVECERCNDKVKQLKDQLKAAVSANMPADQIDALRTQLNGATKEAKQFDTAYKELVKGMRTLDQGIKAFNDGSLSQMNQAFQKALYNAAKLTRTKLNPLSETYKRDKQELTALMDASQQYYARQQADSAMVIKTIKEGGKVSRQAINDELTAHRELLQVLAEDDAGYQRTVKNIAILEQHLRAMGGSYGEIRKNITDTQKVSDEMLRNMYNELQKTNQEGKVTKDIMRENAKAMREIRAEQARRVESTLGGDLTKQNEGAIRQAIASAKELLSTYKTGSKQAQTLSAQIVNAEEHLKTHGVEGERAARKQAEAAQLLADKYKMMQDRVNNLGSLSQGALRETQKFWQEQMDGAIRGSRAYKEAERNLKAIVTEQERLNKVQLQQSAGALNRNNLGTLSEQELQTSIAAAKQLAASMKPTDEAYKQLVDDIVRAEEHIKQFGLEGQRSARQAADQMKAMEDRMKNVKALSSSALEETRRFWQAQMEGAQRGSDAYKQAEANLKVLTAEQEQLTNEQNKAQADRLLNRGNLNTMSESAIRQAITAAREYQQTLKTTDSTYKELSKAILDAEEHIKKFGIEAERSARKEQETEEKAKKALKERIDLMVDQWNRTNSTMSESALKAHERFWQQLIDDPKTAADSLDMYRKNLETVQRVIQQRADAKVEAEGQAALGFFQRGTGDASANEINKQADALKKWRDSLPQQTQADLIKEIDGYLAQTGKTAKDTTDEMMGLAEAMGLASNAGKSAMGMTERDKRDLEWLREEKKLLEEFMNNVTEGSDAWNDYKEQLNEVNDKLRRLPFSGTSEDLKKAQKALEEAIATTDKGTPKYDRLRMALSRIKAEMAGAGISAQRTQEILANPNAEKNIDTLKNAVARARGEMEVMGQRIERMRRLMEQAQKDGNTKWVKRLGESIKQTTKDYDNLAKSTKQADQAQKELANTAKGTASAFDKAWSRLKTYIGLYVGAAVAMQKLTATMGDLMDLSDRMGEVRKTTGFTADEVGRLSSNLKQLDTRTGLTSLMETAAKAGQLGLKTLEDVQGFTQAANMLMVALPEMGQEAATEMLKVALATGEVKKIQEQINNGLIEGSSATEVAMTKIGSTIDQLRANSAAAAPQITDFVKRVGAVGAQSGISIDQVAALGATVDALGMRVEMSATALSRMIPAIKNNAFELAKAIGVTPETVRDLFETGRGMEVILMIFDRIKESGMDADSIENMLGMAGMKDIMKDLNQQGARAGIVFAGLSQNVDELRRNLLTASNAYEENIAILSEYNKMNDTTAAKWERLKNQMEEIFVGDTAQRWLGYLINGIRTIVDLLAGNNSFSAALRIIIVYLGLIKTNIGGIIVGIKNCGGGLKGIVTWLGIIDKETKKMAWGNIFTALAVAALYALHEISSLKSSLDKATESLGKTKEEVGRAQDRFEGYWIKLKETSEALRQSRASHEKLSAEVEKLRNNTDKSASATENLKKKEDELKKSEDKVTQASRDHKSAISDMNSIYGKYLGFILTESNYANLAAAAHDKVTAAIEREMLAKQKQAAIGNVDSQYAQDIATGYGSLNEKLVSYGKLERSEASKAMSDLQRFLRENVRYDSGTNNAVVSKAVTDQLKKSGLDLSKATADEVVALWYDKYLKENYHIGDAIRRGITGVERRRDKNEGWSNVYTPFSTNLRGGYASTYVQREGERGAVSAVYNTDIESAEGKEAKASSTLITKLEQQAKKAKTRILDKGTNAKDRNIAYGELANALEGLENRINELDPRQDAETISRLRNMAKSLSSSGIDIKKLKKARQEIHSTLFERATFNEDDIKNLNTDNPWGKALGAESTDWKNMTAEQLVNRRKQMKDFVNAIQTDTDVQSVLKEDAALKKAIEKGMSSDMRTVIEWYNTERLKIQDELHARHLTNTGDWMDPKKERGARKQFRDEMDAYLHELDAYYTERKTRIEEAGTDEGLTEAEIKNRTLNNEMEWQQRRAELQKLYSRKQKEVTQEELDAIYHIIAERTGDSESFVKAQIAKTNQFVDSIEKSGEKGAAIVHRWMSKVELDTERSYLKGQQALTKQMRAIEAIIDKERPFNGITKSLQESLSTMDILTGDMRKEYNELMKQGKDMTDFNARQHQEEMKRTAFLLGEAENAYSTTIDRVMDDMRQKGMTAWADWLSADPKMQEALMAQLRSTYDAIQDAIKKEASQLKKQAEIMWNNILMPDGKTTLKQQTDRMIAQLGLDEGRVKRANSLIGAGQASERVADKLAIQQMKVQLAMQVHYYNLMKKQGQAHVDMLEAQAKAAKERGDTEEATRKTLDAQHARMSLNLATAKEETELAKQREEIIARTEELQNRLYTELKSWADLLASSLQSVMEASHTADKEYYNERAKLNLTGKGGPGAGTYMIINNEGTEDARAHYEYLNERQALERQREIENDNAVADAWKKMMDDLNQKMSDTITDQLNAMLQNKATEDNTAELQNLQQKLKDEQTKLDANTQAVQGLTQQLAQGITINKDGETGGNLFAADKQDGYPNAPKEAPSNIDFASDKQAGYPGQYSDQANTDATNANTIAMNNLTAAMGGQPVEGTPGADMGSDFATDKMGGYPSGGGEISPEIQKQIDESNLLTDTKIANEEKEVKAETEGNKKEQQSKQSMFAKMTAAANLYGVAYQAMSNDNLSTTQKFEMMALQAVGNYAIGALTTEMAAASAKAATDSPGVLGTLWKELGWAAAPVFAIFTGLLGGLMGLATSKIGKAKSTIAQATGASMNAGRLSTGMLTYAEGNVNEFTDPASLTPGRSYNVDGADGKTYRAKFTGSDPKTHITNGPEFHLVGEAGREAIIDAHTTRLMQMDDSGIWNAIQTLYNGGSLSAVRRRSSRRGVRAFADGNLDEFDEMADGGGLMTDTGISMEQMAAFQQSLDRNSAIMERLEANGIHAYFDVYGKGGLIDSYDKGKKTVESHGEKY